MPTAEMNWQAYIESSLSRLLGTGAVDGAVIIEKSTGNILAASPGFSISEGELEEITDIFETQAPGDGSFEVAGKSYFASTVDPLRLYGTHKTDGVCIVNTAQFIVFTHFSSPSSLDQAALHVEQLCDELIKMGL